MDTQPAITTRQLVLDVLGTTNDYRMTHGLRHNDYTRYRQFCARKIARIRKGLGLTQEDSRRKGKGKSGFVKRTVDDLIVDEMDVDVDESGDGDVDKSGGAINRELTDRHLQILLFETERSWAYAMQLKRESTAEPRKRHHLIGRLRKAEESSARLLSVVEKVDVEGRTRLDVEAYASLMSGYVLFEQQQWQAALDKFAASRTIYEKMSLAGSPSQEALCQSAIDSLDPNIRYCAYNLKLKGGQTMDIPSLMEMRNKSGGGVGLDLLAAKVEEILSQTRHDKATEIQSITWRETTIPTRNEKLIESLLTAQETVDALDGFKGEYGSDEHLALFDGVLSAWGDAAKLVEEDVKADTMATTKITTSKSATHTSTLQFAYGYVTYTRIMHTIARNQVLIHNIERKLDQSAGKRGSRREDVVKLIDAVLQGLGEVAELSVVGGDRGLSGLVAARVGLFKAKRASTIAQIHATALSHTPAIALYTRAQDHITYARSELPASEPESKEIERELRTVEKSVRGGKIREEVKRSLEAQGKVEGVVKGVEGLGLDDVDVDVDIPSEKPLMNSLDTFHTTFLPPSLITFPPQFEAVMCKPLFFDIAFGGVEYPLENLERRAKGGERVVRGREKKGEKGGLIAGIWGWGRK